MLDSKIEDGVWIARRWRNKAGKCRVQIQISTQIFEPEIQLLEYNLFCALPVIICSCEFECFFTTELTARTSSYLKHITFLIALRKDLHKFFYNYFLLP